MSVMGMCISCGSPAVGVCRLCGRTYCPIHMSLTTMICDRCDPAGRSGRVPSGVMGRNRGNEDDGKD